MSVWNECVITLRQIHLLLLDTLVSFQRVFACMCMLINQLQCFRLPSWLHERSLLWLCVFRARSAIMCIRACAVVSESKDKQRLSAGLPAAALIDVDGNRGTHHPWKTNYMIGSVVWHRRRVHLIPSDGFIYSLFNSVLRHRFGFVIHVYSLVLIGLLSSHFLIHFWFLHSLFKLCNYIWLKSAS